MRALAGIGIISLLIAIAVAAFLATKQLARTSGAGNAKQTVDTATAVKNKANLQSLAVKLNVYFSENEAYPRNLSEIDTVGVDLTSFQYSFCSATSVIVTSGGENLILNNGQSSYSTTTAVC